MSIKNFQTVVKTTNNMLDQNDLVLTILIVPSTEKERQTGFSPLKYVKNLC